jgi:hypothetical protein
MEYQAYLSKVVLLYSMPRQQAFTLSISAACSIITKFRKELLRYVKPTEIN